MDVEPRYRAFCDYARQVAASKDLCFFKIHPPMMQMIEHVSYEQGREYRNVILERTSLKPEDFRPYLDANDRVGGGKRYVYDRVLTGPINFRFVLHAHLALQHMNRLGMTDVKIVQVGCGYGGLCLAISLLSPLYGVCIEAYHLIDFEAVGELHRLYLEEHRESIHFPTEYHPAALSGADIVDRNMFLISNFCLSEISEEHRQKYLSVLFPKVSHGFMTWNGMPDYPLGFPVHSEPEYPQTGANNRYIYF